MLIKNKISGKESSVSQEQWKAIIAKNWVGKFTVIPKSIETPVLKVPEESKPASFKDLVAAARECDGKADLIGALEHYKKAFKLRATNKLAQRINEIEEELKKD